MDLDSSLLGRIRESFDNIFPAGYAHQRHTRYFSDPSLQVSVICSHDVDLVFDDAVDNTIVSIDALVPALEPFKSLVSGDA